MTVVKNFGQSINSVLKRWGPAEVKCQIWDREFQSGHWDHLQAPSLFMEFLQAHLKDGERILDLGCGVGNVAVTLKNDGWSGWYTGVDISGVAIRRAKKSRRSKRCQWIVSDIERFNPKMRYDTILFLESIYYVPILSVKSVLSRYARSLTSNGRIIVRIWNFKKHKAYIHLLEKLYANTERHRFGDAIVYLIKA